MKGPEPIGKSDFERGAALVLVMGFLLGCPLPEARIFADGEMGGGEDATVLEGGENGDGLDASDGSTDVGSEMGDVLLDVTETISDLGQSPSDVHEVDAGPSDVAGGDAGLQDAGDDAGGAPDLGTGCAGAAECKTLGPCSDAVPICGEGGQWICDYSQVDAYDGDVELRCDDVDNDCDGSVDEDFGIGIPCDGPDGDLCANGVRVCSDDQQSWACGDESQEDLVEVCDGVDNDCDGTVDEGVGPTQLPCDSNGDGCSTGLLLCDEAGGVQCVGDFACEQPNPHCVPASKPLDPDVCACAPGIFCDPVTASGCPLGKCQCGFLGNACVDGAVCNGSQCVIP